MIKINDLTEVHNLKIRGTYLIHFNCEQCNEEDTYQLRILRKYTDLLCHKCRRYKNYHDKAWLKIKNDHFEETSLRIHGVKHFTNRQKACETCKRNNGGIGFGSEKIKNKIRQTNIEKHNNPDYRNTEKMIQTATKNGGCGAARFSTKIKMENTLYKRTGYNHNWSIPEERKVAFEKMKEANKEKYGVENVMQVPEIRAKIHKKWYFDNVYFDSSWELMYYIWLKDNNINFEYQKDRLPYYFNNKLRYYEVDFTVDGKYVEIKGPQSFDKNGNMINIYDRTLDDVANHKYYCMLSNNVEIITNIEPYENYINNKYGKNYINNFREENKDV